MKAIPILPESYYSEKVIKALQTMKHYKGGSNAYHDRLAYIGVLLLGAYNDGYTIIIQGDHQSEGGE